MRLANLFTAVVFASFANLPAAAETADAIFTGGDILTMRGPAAEYAESLAVKDGTILFVGPRAEAEKLVGPETKTIDLAGKTLLPGFIDTHGHFIYFGKNLDDANLFGCTDIADLVARMKKQVAQTPADGWIVGFGYQARALEEKRPPTCEELDQVSADRPVMVVDSSGHLGAANAAAFKATGITADTPDPTGGKSLSGAMASWTFLRAGLPFTYSHDAPVSPVPSILALVDAGVNRRSGSGQVVGPDERVSPYDALRAVASTAAYQLEEEKTKGTLEPGKLADLVILDKNPLKVEPTTIKDIAVVETIKDGRTVFAR